MKFVSLCRYLDRFLRHLQSNSKAVLNRAKFWTFFAFPNFNGGGAPQMLYKSDNVPLIACRVAKFHGVTPFNPKVIGANTLNYKPIFDPL